MAKSYNQKAKLLFLEQLMHETGENHAVTMQEILEKLAELGIRAERKSIYDDMEALRDFGMDIKFKRGKPGGYYLAGQTVPERVVTPAKKQGEPERRPEERAAEGPAKRPGEEPAERPEERPGEGPAEKPEAKFTMGKALDGKKMKLLCSLDREKEIRAYFGRYAEYKEKGADTFIATAPNMGDAQFFGWLTAMGRDVYIIKPKKTAAAYRDYLKMLTREYKGI